jgi:peptidoglycan/LPS O-acetylase OafA/YrhL
VLVAFGDASYAVYLLHFPLLQLLFRYLGRDLTWAEFAIFSTALLVLCLLIYRWMEQPMRRGIRARFRQMRVAAIP